MASRAYSVAKVRESNVGLRTLPEVPVRDSSLNLLRCSEPFDWTDDAMNKNNGGK